MLKRANRTVSFSAYSRTVSSSGSGERDRAGPPRRATFDQAQHCWQRVEAPSTDQASTTVAVASCRDCVAFERLVGEHLWCGRRPEHTHCKSQATSTKLVGKAPGGRVTAGEQRLNRWSPGGPIDLAFLEALRDFCTSYRAAPGPRFHVRTATATTTKLVHHEGTLPYQRFRLAARIVRSVVRVRGSDSCQWILRDLPKLDQSRPTTRGSRMRCGPIAVPRDLRRRSSPSVQT
jgi:hypothetical protein